MEKELKINIPEGYEIDKENSTFEYIKFKKKKELPKSWNEYLISFICSFSDLDSRIALLERIMPSKYIALYKLELLRDCWREGWKPDWNDNTCKYVIYKKKDIIWAGQNDAISRTLTFNTREKAKKFISYFSDLILEAEDLI